MSEINYQVGAAAALPQAEAKTEVLKPDTVKSEEAVKSSEQEPQPMIPPKDEYISSKGQKSSGLYNVSRDKDGKTVIQYDDPRKNASRTDISLSVTNLKTKRDSIKIKIKTESDDGKVRELKRKLKTVEKQIKEARPNVMP